MYLLKLELVTGRQSLIKYRECKRIYPSFEPLFKKIENALQQRWRNHFRHLPEWVCANEMGFHSKLCIHLLIPHLRETSAASLMLSLYLSALISVVLSRVQPVQMDRNCPKSCLVFSLSWWTPGSLFKAFRCWRDWEINSHHPCAVSNMTERSK